MKFIEEKEQEKRSFRIEEGRKLFAHNKCILHSIEWNEF